MEATSLVLRERRTTWGRVRRVPNDAVVAAAVDTCRGRQRSSILEDIAPRNARSGAADHVDGSATVV